MAGGRMGAAKRRAFVKGNKLEGAKDLGLRGATTLNSSRTAVLQSVTGH